MDGQLNLFSFSVGVLALVSTVFSMVMFLRGQLPSARMKHLDELFDETNTIFQKAISDGLLPNEAFRVLIGERLTRVDDTRELLRTAACHATSSLDEVKALLRGLSKAIMVLMDELKQLRRCVMTTGQMERVRRLGQTRTSISPSPLPVAENLPTSSIDAQISTNDTEASYETADNLLPPAPNIDFSALLNHSPHQAINCSLCLVGTNSHTDERDPSSPGHAEPLPTIREPRSLSTQVNKDPHWFIRCLRSLGGFWTGMYIRRDSIERPRDFIRVQPSSTLDSAASRSFTSTEEPTRLFGYWGGWRGGLPKSYSTSDLRLETHRNDWSFSGSSPHQSTRGREDRSHHSLDLASLPV